MVDTSIKALIDQGQQQLSAHNIASAAIDAELLLCHCLNKTRTYLYTWPDTLISTTQSQHYFDLIRQRAQQIPVAYLTGKREFWSLSFNVSPEVLIPRPDTELLVEVALEKMTAIPYPKIADLGTGSGAIAISLATEYENATFIATDIAEESLVVARQNSIEHHVAQQITFLNTSWFDGLSTSEHQFDLIISNPPYIAENDTHLLNEDIKHEPIRALTAGISGMDDLKIIIEQAPYYLKHRGWILLEHGYDQGEACRTLLSDNNHYESIETLQDLAGNDRITLACRKLGNDPLQD